MYYLQGSYGDGRICHEESFESEPAATGAARALLSSAFFEGSKVRVITIDGELVFEGSVIR